MICGSCLRDGVRFAGRSDVGSKASWDEIAGDVPRFDAGLPPPT